MAHAQKKEWSGRGRRPNGMGPQTEKRCPRCETTKPRSEFNLRKNGKTLQSYCKDCMNKNGRKWAKDNLEQHRDNVYEWRSENREQDRFNNRKWREQNPEKVKEITRRTYYKHREKILAYGRKYYYENRERASESFRAWRIRNADRVAHNSRMYDARKKQACPEWVDREEIAKVYECRYRVSKKSGEEYHVDHIVPLCSGLVCGLHVPWNLRVIPARENQSKSNRVWPDMPDEDVA